MHRIGPKTGVLSDDAGGNASVITKIDNLSSLERSGRAVLGIDPEACEAGKHAGGNAAVVAQIDTASGFEGRRGAMVGIDPEYRVLRDDA